MSRFIAALSAGLALMLSSSANAALLFTFELDTNYIEVGTNEVFYLNGTLTLSPDSDGPIGGFNFGGPSYGYTGDDFANHNWDFDMSQFDGVLLNPGQSVSVAFGSWTPIGPVSPGLRTILYPTLAFIDYGDDENDWEQWEWYHAVASNVDVNIIERDPGTTVPEPSALLALAAGGWALLFARRFGRAHAA